VIPGNRKRRLFYAAKEYTGVYGSNIDGRVPKQKKREKGKSKKPSGHRERGGH